MGRPSKLTDAVRERIATAVGSGNYLEAAAGYAGISRATFWRWMERGERERTGQYRAFRDAIREAEARAEVRMVAQWQQAIPEDWRAAAEFLARRFPDRWARRDHLDVSADVRQAMTFEPTNDPRVVDAGVRFLALAARSSDSSGEDEPGGPGDPGKPRLVEAGPTS